ncbi:MAG TPA: hypothetical protein PKN14_06450 [Bacteroidia bacterium]|nr:MAG: OmpA family protein [Bacteroidetes bacterium OLB10]MBE7510801.1 hypothetical protein [Bacteroidia bacterium]MBX3107451.1 hypothetical protein [Bacteroidota bacterium]OQB61104.1 MAG: hypothetical protein BWX95_01944 [Bacteroidetes bacterium ADurb.Bin141]MCB0850091.1 hypothetical protein [Bacteroidota bacterium]
MKKLITTLCIASFVMTAQAQRTFDIGLSGGATNYFGDLGNNEVLQATSTRPGGAITFRNFLNNPSRSGFQYQPFSIEARISWQRIGYDETKPIGDKKGYQLRNYGRGLSFRTDVYGVSTHLSYTLYTNRRKPLYSQGAAMFFYVGVGVYYARPKADLFHGSIDINNRYYYWNDGTVRDQAESTGHGNVIKKDGKFETNLDEWRTEGQGYSSELGQKRPYNLMHIGFPMGLGWRWGLSKNLTLSAELSYIKFVTDYLDDVSQRYATYEEINANFPDPEKQQLAKYISDPTGRGTDGFEGPQTSKRGNYRKTDGYAYLSLELAYKINFNWGKLKGHF